MKTFIGGEIKERCRGNLAFLLVEPYDREPRGSSFVVPHLVEVLSSEFNSLTNPSSRDTLLRAYVGVTEDSCSSIVGEMNESNGAVAALSRLDVYDYFLVSSEAYKNHREAPQKIELTLTESGKYSLDQKLA